MPEIDELPQRKEADALLLLRNFVGNTYVAIFDEFSSWKMLSVAKGGF